MDIWSKEKRSAVMSKIRGKDTKPELLLRSFLSAQGFRYRLHCKDLPGKPDIVFRKKKVAIFVHGCFWHYHATCREGRIPSTNSKFWQEKLSKNVERDQRHSATLKALGWKVIVIWECDIEQNFEKTVKNLLRVLKSEK